MRTAQQNPREQSSSRFAWVDIAKGICIVAVVCLYTFHQLENMGLDPGWLSSWSAFARPFRMPDFFLISGLFLSRVIDRPWRQYLDTKVLHYFYFIVLWSIFIFLWNWGGQLSEMGAYKSAKLFAYVIYRPEAMLWFIQTLAFYFVVTRLLRRAPAMLMLLAGLLLRVSEYRTGIYPIDWFGEFYFFFLCGVFFAKHWFAIADWAVQHRRLSWSALIAWVVFNEWMVESTAIGNAWVLVGVGMVGITAVIMFSSLINDQRWAYVFRYLGKNSIVVYLGFYLPLLWMSKAYVQSQITINHHLLGALLVILGIAAAVALFVVTRSSPLRFLFERPAWARLSTHKASPRSSAAAPAAHGEASS